MRTTTRTRSSPEPPAPRRARELPDDGGEVFSGLDRAEHPRLDDGLGDATRRGLFAVVPQDSRQLLGVGAGDELGGALAGVGAHAHVERARALEREAALGAIELQGGAAEVGQDGVEGPGQLVELVEAMLAQRGAVAEAGQHLAGDGEGVRVAVDADHPGLREALQDGLGVTAAAEGQIEHARRGLNAEGEGLQNLVKQHRLVQSIPRRAGVGPGGGR